MASRYCAATASRLACTCWAVSRRPRSRPEASASALAAARVSSECTSSRTGSSASGASAVSPVAPGVPSASTGVTTPRALSSAVGVLASSGDWTASATTSAPLVAALGNKKGQRIRRWLPLRARLGRCLLSWLHYAVIAALLQCSPLLGTHPLLLAPRPAN